MGRIYQQTFVDTYAKVGFAKLYDVKTAITAADLLNDRVLPFFEERGIPRDPELVQAIFQRAKSATATLDEHAVLEICRAHAQT